MKLKYILSSILFSIIVFAAADAFGLFDVSGLSVFFRNIKGSSIIFCFGLCLVSAYTSWERFANIGLFGSKGGFQYSKKVFFRSMALGLVIGSPVVSDALRVWFGRSSGQTRVNRLVIAVVLDRVSALGMMLAILGFWLAPVSLGLIGFVIVILVGSFLVGFLSTVCNFISSTALVLAGYVVQESGVDFASFSVGFTFGLLSSSVPGFFMGFGIREILYGLSNSFFGFSGNLVFYSGAVISCLVMSSIAHFLLGCFKWSDAQ